MIFPTVTRLLLPRLATRSMVLAPNVYASLQTRRAWLSTSYPLLYAAASATKTKKTTKSKSKAAADAETTKPKKAAKKKPTAKPKKVKKVKKTPKPRMIITPLDRPPKSAGSPFILFVSKYLSGIAPEDKASREHMSKHAKEAGRTWKALTDAERKPFQDEFEKISQRKRAEREQYFLNVDQKVLNELNKRRAKLGKSKIRRKLPREERRPISAFLRFLADFRTSADSQAIASSSTTPSIDLAREAGKRWNALSEAGKEPYKLAFQEAQKEYESKRSTAA